MESDEVPLEDQESVSDKISDAVTQSAATDLPVLTDGETHAPAIDTAVACLARGQ